MKFTDYQDISGSTDIYPKSDLSLQLSCYAMGLASEAGEVAGVVKKWIRDGVPMDQVRTAAASEIGDVLWYLAQLCSGLGLSLDDIAGKNLQKLASRQARGVLGGSGGER